MTIKGESTAGTVAKQLALSFIPAASGATAKQLDPTLRDTISFLDEIKARTPGLSSTLPPRRDVFGEPVVADRIGLDIVSPVARDTISTDPVRQLFSRLNIETSKNLNSMKQISKIDLTPEQHSQFVGDRGKMLKEILDGVVGDSSFQDRNELPDSPQSKQAFIRHIMNKTQAQSEKMLLDSDPALAEKVMGNKELLQEGHPIEQQ
jgi:hypothetical protein